MSRPVVLVHGLASSSASTWHASGLVELITDLGREVHEVDLLGHGTAPQPHDPEAYRDLAGWLAGALPTTAVDVVGFSLGARLVLEVAARQLAPIHSIVAAGVGANLFRDPSESIAQSEALADALSADSATDDPLVAHFRRLCHTSGTDRAAVAALLRRPHIGTWPPDWSQVTQPTTVIVGEHDFAGPADPLVEVLTNARGVVVRRADHFSLPKEMAFIDAVLGHLEQHP